MKLSTNFGAHEFGCHDGTPVPPEYMPNVLRMVPILEVIRAEANRRFPAATPRKLNVKSAFRTVKYNRKCGGVRGSQHLTASAVDLTIDGLTPDQVADLIEDLIAEGKIKLGGLGRYDDFTHVDLRRARKRWDHRTDGKRG